MSCLNHRFNINNFSSCHHEVQTISNSHWERPHFGHLPYVFRLVVEPSLSGLAADCLRESSQQLEDFRHSVTTMKRTHFTNFATFRLPISVVSYLRESIEIYVHKVRLTMLESHDCLRLPLKQQAIYSKHLYHL